MLTDISSHASLLKKKLGELQQIAINEDINISIEGTTKKKTKIQLAQEIFNKIN